MEVKSASTAMGLGTNSAFFVWIDPISQTIHWINRATWLSEGKIQAMKRSHMCLKIVSCTDCSVAPKTSLFSSPTEVILECRVPNIHSSIKFELPDDKTMSKDAKRMWIEELRDIRAAAGKTLAIPIALQNSLKIQKK